MGFRCPTRDRCAGRNIIRKFVSTAFRDPVIDRGRYRHRPYTRAIGRSTNTSNVRQFFLFDYSNVRQFFLFDYFDHNLLCPEWGEL